MTFIQPKLFEKARILCLGDAMLDRFIYGKVQRISPEAPVVVINYESTLETLGGACNVCRNLSSLKANVCYVGVTGVDQGASRLKELLAYETKNFFLGEDSSRPTTIKTRYYGESHQILRVDTETVCPISSLLESSICSFVESEHRAHPFQTVIISDYAKGVVTPTLMDWIIAFFGKEIPILVDPKGDDFSKYRGSFLLTPNERELRQALNFERDIYFETVEEGALALLEKYDIAHMIVTRGKQGATLFSCDDKKNPYSVRSGERDVFDVSGAGDTFIATLALGICQHLSLEAACFVATRASGRVVEKKGTAVLTPQEFQDELGIEKETDTLASIKDFVDKKRSIGHRIVFTNGCFDVLHTGHLKLLREASSLGDFLIVGLNSDASVKRLKGEKRPFQSERVRREILSSLKYVGSVVIFTEDTPLNLIWELAPDVLVKGGDYTIDTIVGAREVLDRGGRVVTIPLEEGQSTSDFIKNISSCI